MNLKSLQFARFSGLFPFWRHLSQRDTKEIPRRDRSGVLPGGKDASFVLLHFQFVSTARKPMFVVWDTLLGRRFYKSSMQPVSIHESEMRS